MIALVVAVAAVCELLAIALAWRAWSRLGPVRRWIVAERRRAGDLPTDRACRLEGVLEPAGTLVVAPFTERPALWVRARLRGIAPDGGPARVLWERTLIAPARLVGPHRSFALDLAAADVVVPAIYRQGVVRALVPDVHVLPRVLARVGYTAPPPPARDFMIEEEVLLPGVHVDVLGRSDGAGALVPGDGPLLVSDLDSWRIALRLAWGPALAVVNALVIALVGIAVVLTGWWLV